jgi:Tol biopolymer transport system component
MPLGPGTKLGPYVIDTLLGAGGMGEVYKARDSRLNRTVAIKILPELLSGNAEFRDRFEREARLVAALSHPHVCVLHDVGREGPTAYLVMEYLEGETLSTRLRRGPLAITQALQIAVEVAEALAHAHQHGIIHRDLKPGNVMLTRSGAKLLDFGLARTADGPAIMSDASMATATEPLTARGTILGTFRYMPPEQLEGRRADARSDLFAFGVLLYEALTGVPPFKGDSSVALIGAILKDTPPDPSALRPDTPVVLDHIVRRCLAKDPERRWQNAADLAAEIRWAADATAKLARPAEPPMRRLGILWLIAGIVVGAAAVLLSLWSVRGVRPVPVLLPIAGPPDTAVQGIEIAPDGRRLVFAAAAAGRSATLWVSSTGSVTPRSLEGTDGASMPFWSPDSQTLGFFADGRLKRVPADGGPVTMICAAPFARGAVWTGHSIVFSAALAMQVVVDTGGAPAPVPGMPPGGSPRWPSMLPDQRHFVYYEGKGRSDLGGIFVASLDGGAPIPILSDALRAIYVAPGYLVYGSGATLLAQAFDARTFRKTGEPVAIATDLWFDLTALGLVNASASSDGSMLVYRTGGEERTQLTWYSHLGEIIRTVGDPATYMNVELSEKPDRVLVSIADPRNGHRAVSTMDLSDGKWTRLSLGETDDDLNPVFSPDGSEIAFTSTNEARTALYRRSATGGERTRITSDNKARFARAWSADGQRLIVDALRIDKSVGTEVLTLADGSSTPLEPADVEAWFGQISPNGKWIAYSATKGTGRFEIYVRPFPLTGAPWQISAEGGLEPRWRGDGRELYFISPDQHIVAVAVDGSNGTIRTDSAHSLFQIRITRADRPDTLNHYAVTSDGKQFLVAAQPQRSGAVAAAIAGWKALLPGK